MERNETKLTRVLLYLIFSVVLAGGAWAAIVPLEEVVEGLGVAIPLVDPVAVSVPRAGTVVDLHFKTADEVVEGEALLSLSLVDEYVLTAPVSGTVIWQREFLSGDWVEARKRVAVVYPHGPMGFEAAIPQHNLGLIEPGMSVRLQVHAYPYQQFGTLQGEVQEISLYPEQGTLQAKARIAVTDDDLSFRLLPGMTAQVEIITGSSTWFQQLF